MVRTQRCCHLFWKVDVRLKCNLLAVTGLLVLHLTGCTTTGQTPPAEKVDPKSISAEAADLLTQAEADIAYAQAKFALWTSAETALAAARDAALRGDSVETIRQARFASGQARLGIGQLDYPSTERK